MRLTPEQAEMVDSHARSDSVVASTTPGNIAKSLFVARTARILDLRERAERAETACANQEYRGHSVQHWWGKAEAYGRIVQGCTPALQRAGYAIDSNASDGPSASIAAAVEALVERAEQAEADRKVLAAEVQMWRDHDHWEGVCDHDPPQCAVCRVVDATDASGAITRGGGA